MTRTSKSGRRPEVFDSCCAASINTAPEGWSIVAHPLHPLSVAPLFHGPQQRLPYPPCSALLQLLCHNQYGRCTCCHLQHGHPCRPKQTVDHLQLYSHCVYYNCGGNISCTSRHGICLAASSCILVTTNLINFPSGPPRQKANNRGSDPSHRCSASHT